MQGHGGLFEYLTEDEFEQRFDGLADSLTHPISEIDLAARLAPVLSSIRDGHTTIRLSTELEALLRSAQVWLPFEIVVIDRAIHLFPYRPSDLDIESGCRLVAMQGIPAATLLKRAMVNMSGDGLIESGKLWSLQRRRAFSAQLHLQFGPLERFKVEWEDSSGDVRTSSVDGWTAADVDSAHGRRRGIAESATAFAIEGEVGRLTLRSFEPPKRASRTMTFAEFLETSFETLREEGTRALIIDLRGNGGGDDTYGRLLFSHLAREPFQYYESLVVRAQDFSFLDHTDAKGRTPPPDMFVTDEDGTKMLRRHPNLGTHDQREPTFAGDVVMLMDGGSFSTTSEFLAMAKGHEIGRFVGTESGGTMSGNTSGLVPTLTLPNSKLRVRIPLVRYKMAVDVPLEGRGVIPDHEVSATVDDILRDRDPALERARDLLR